MASSKSRRDIREGLPTEDRDPVSSNPLEMDAEDFEFYIKEMGYDSTDPVKAKFLRDEWTKANTLGGKATSSYEEATAVPEGRTRMGILPFTKPEGMTGREAILSGQTELAFPGFMTGVGEAVADTLSTGEKMTSGISTTQEELDQAALTLGELAMVATVPTTAPSGSVRSGLGVTKKKSQINPLFKPKDTADSDITFYSPLRSAIQEMQFSDKGKLGQEIMAYLNKRAPNINKGEIEFSRINLDPKKKYSKEEVLSSLQFSTEDTVAKVREGKEAVFKGQQIPKNYVDKPSGYFEITLDTKDIPGEINTHFAPNTVAHSRTTIHKDKNGKEYFVINELQSDALQNVGKQFSVPDPVEAVSDIKAFLALDANVYFNEAVFDFFEQEALKPTLNKADLKKVYKDKFGVEVEGKNIGQIHKDAIRKSVDENINEYDLSYLEERIDRALLDFENYAIELKKAEAGYKAEDVPFSSTTAYVKNLLIANIAKAKQQGVDSIVIPDLNEIVRLRSEDFEGGFEAARKALKPTYVDAVRKAVNILNSEYSDRIKLGTKEIDYRDLTKPNKTRTTKGLELNISNFDFDPAKQKVRFAEGGLAMDDQMNKLFMARGGLKDDGMNMDPVSGNEIPPGSLAQEVRDDIPAQLSDGEYVVPADVVRYYGVKFFEDLRQEAKTGLSDMEMNGRIGGEPASDMAGGNAAPTMIGGMPARDIPPEMLAELARQGQAPTQMAEGGVASPRAGFMQGPGFSRLLRDRLGDERANELVFGKDKKDKEPEGPQYKSETPTFNPLDYMAGYPGIVGSSTIGQIGTTLPGYTYRYIDPITGEIIPVAPGTTPPPGAIPAPVEVPEPFDPYEGRDDRESNAPTEVEWNPDNTYGISFNDPIGAGKQALESTFVEKGVVAGATLLGGPGLGAAAAAISQGISLSRAEANLLEAERQYGKDDPRVKGLKEDIEKAKKQTMVDNIIPGAVNGTMRHKQFTNMRIKQGLDVPVKTPEVKGPTGPAKVGSTDTTGAAAAQAAAEVKEAPKTSEGFADLVSNSITLGQGGAFEVPEAQRIFGDDLGSYAGGPDVKQGGLGQPVNLKRDTGLKFSGSDTPRPMGNEGERGSDRDDGPTLGGAGTAFDTTGIDPATADFGGAGYLDDYRETDFMDDFDVDEEGYVDFGFNKGGLMKRKSPVKRK